MRNLALLGLLGQAALSAAHPQTQKGGLRKRTVDLDAFRLQDTAEYVKHDDVDEVAPILGKRADYVTTATELVKKKVPGATFRVSDAYTGTNGIAHVYFRQTAHGLDIDNTDFNVNIGPDGAVFSYGNSFYTGSIPEENPTRKRAFKDPVAALKDADSRLELGVSSDSATAEASDEAEVFKIKGTSGAQEDPEARLVYLVKPDGELTLTWRVETDILSNWLLSYVDATTSDVHAVVDYGADATYEVYPWGVNDPTVGERRVIRDPFDSGASEFGWHDTGNTKYTVTRGNNAIAHINPSGGSSYENNYRPDGGSGLNFEFPYSPSMSRPSEYVDASVAQLFYSGNVYHDYMYNLGFTEAAGNFEVNNNGAGGRGNDFVVLNAQDGSGTNNARFSTPPDGRPGRMQMFMWTRSTPRRDCSFDLGVVIHEYTHGLTNRLTGGPGNTRCLNTIEAGGMGEGWSDFVATAIRLQPGDTRATDYPVGAWVFNNPVGIRRYVYSTDMTTNPHTYADADGLRSVHAVGTIWATMLYEMMWNIIDKVGRRTSDDDDDDDDDFFKVRVRRDDDDNSRVPSDGRDLAVKLMTDALALQPCNPNFVQARDAILDADRALTNGSNLCEIWTAFAKRGLGEGARFGNRRTESFEVPAGVC